MEISRRFKAAIAATLLVGAGWAANSVAGTAGAATAVRPSRGETTTTFQRGEVARGGGLQAQALGELNGLDGVFHPIEPCRIVDTSQPTSLLGTLAAGEERGFWAITFDGGFEDFGGEPTSCGVPDTASAVQVNLVAKNASANGFLRLFPFDSVMPTAAFVAYTPGVNIANSGVVKLCRNTDGSLCDFDFSVFTSRTSDVIVDVMGYYEGPLSARVNDDGTVNAISLAVVAVETDNVVPGYYKVVFDRDVSACVYMATLDPHTFLSETGEVSTAPWSLDEPEAVFVQTTDSDGNLADHSFSLVVHC